MSAPDPSMKYDEVLTSILVNEKSILGFLSAIFNFLARRTDFYYVPEGPYENMGFPPGVAEELVVKVLRTCDPKNWKAPNGAKKPNDVNNEIMCSTVAQEVEVVTEGEEIDEETPSTSQQNEQNISSSINALNIHDHNYSQMPVVPKPDEKIDVPKQSLETEEKMGAVQEATDSNIDEKPPVIPLQKSETYNGADRGHYCWSQTIMELDVIVKLPPDIKSAKDLKVTINSGDICIAKRNGDIIIKDTLPYKIKTIDSFWSVSEGKVLMHLEKVQERWWNKLLNQEEAIDLEKIDCSRPLDELPQDHIDKVRELQWNQQQKLKGLPTSDQIRNIDVLKKAWNAPGSPFQGKPFDPSVLSENIPSFSGDN